VSNLILNKVQNAVNFVIHDFTIQTNRLLMKCIIKIIGYRRHWTWIHEWWKTSNWI